MSPVDKPPKDDNSSNKSSNDSSNTSTSTSSSDNANTSNTQTNSGATGAVDATLSYGSLSDNATVVKNKLEQVRSYIQQTSTAMQGLESQADMSTETTNQDEPVADSTLNSQNKGQVSSVTVDRLDFDSTASVPRSNFSDRLIAGMAEATELTERLRDSVARREDLVDRYRATQQRLLALKRQRRDITQQERSLLLAQTNRDSFYEDAIPGASGWTLDELNTGLVDFRALYEKVSTLRSAYDTKINALAEGDSAGKAEIEAKITQLETKKTQLVAIITQLKHLRAIRRSEQGLDPEEEEDSTAAPPTAGVVVTSSTGTAVTSSSSGTAASSTVTNSSGTAVTSVSSEARTTVADSIVTGNVNSIEPASALTTSSAQETVTVKQSHETEDTADDADDSPISAVITARAQMVAAGQELALRNQHLSNLKEELEGMKRLLDISQKTMSQGEGSSNPTASDTQTPPPPAGGQTAGVEVEEFVEGVNGTVLQLNATERQDPLVIAKYKQLKDAKERMAQMESIMDVIKRGKGTGKSLRELLTDEQLALLEQAQAEDEEEPAPPRQHLPTARETTSQRGANARVPPSDPRVRELLNIQDELLQKSRNLDALMGELSNKDPSNDLRTAGEGDALGSVAGLTSDAASLGLPPLTGLSAGDSDTSADAVSQLEGMQSNIDRLYESLKERKQQDHLLKVQKHQQTLQEHKNRLQEQQEKMAQQHQKLQLQQQQLKNQQNSTSDCSLAASSQTHLPMTACGTTSQSEGATAYLPPPLSNQMNSSSSDQSTLNQCLSQLYLHSLELQGLNKHIQLLEQRLDNEAKRQPYCHNCSSKPQLVTNNFSPLNNSFETSHPSPLLNHHNLQSTNNANVDFHHHVNSTNLLLQHPGQYSHNIYNNSLYGISNNGVNSSMNTGNEHLQYPVPLNNIRPRHNCLSPSSLLLTRNPLRDNSPVAVDYQNCIGINFREMSTGPSMDSGISGSESRDINPLLRHSSSILARNNFQNGEKSRNNSCRYNKLPRFTNKIRNRGGYMSTSKNERCQRSTSRESSRLVDNEEILQPMELLSIRNSKSLRLTKRQRSDHRDCSDRSTTSETCTNSSKVCHPNCGFDVNNTQKFKQGPSSWRNHQTCQQASRSLVSPRNSQPTHSDIKCKTNSSGHNKVRGCNPLDRNIADTSREDSYRRSNHPETVSKDEHFLLSLPITKNSHNLSSYANYYEDDEQLGINANCSGDNASNHPHHKTKNTRRYQPKKSIHPFGSNFLESSEEFSSDDNNPSFGLQWEPQGRVSDEGISASAGLSEDNFFPFVADSEIPIVSSRNHDTTRQKSKKKLPPRKPFHPFLSGHMENELPEGSNGYYAALNASIHITDEDSATACNDVLNNQVSPGVRANNYWDNFRSYTHQNLLSLSPNNSYRNSSKSYYNALGGGVEETRSLSPPINDSNSFSMCNFNRQHMQASLDSSDCASSRSLCHLSANCCCSPNNFKSFIKTQAKTSNTNYGRLNNTSVSQKYLSEHRHNVEREFSSSRSEASSPRGLCPTIDRNPQLVSNETVNNEQNGSTGNISTPNAGSISTPNAESISTPIASSVSTSNAATVNTSNAGANAIPIAVSASSSDTEVDDLLE